MATPYGVDGNELPLYQFAAKAAGGLYTTAPDLARFVAASIAGGSGTPIGRGVLEPKNAVIVAPGRLDRSATGTGLSARMAALHARGMMQVGDAMTHASVIGSTFDGRIVSETTVGGRSAIVPAIRGSAWITGVTQVVVDPTDPFPEGYVLADTWPGKDVQL